jgi:MFS family permease
VVCIGLNALQAYRVNNEGWYLSQQVTSMATLVHAPRQGTTFSALRHRNFRLYISGQLVSISGMWMQSVAQGWLIFHLTRSELALGLVACAAGIPSLFLSPFAGVVVDRFPRRTLLMITHTVQLIQAFLMAALVLSDTVQVWHIVLVAFVMGISNSVDAPARQAFIKDMVGGDDLTSGININSLMINGARVVGPAFAGMLLATVGAGWCFLLRGFSVLAILLSLSLMHMEGRVPGVGRGSALRQMREGMHFSRHHATILPLLLMAAVISTFAVNTMTLLPSFADTVLHLPVNGLSLLTIAQGVGAVIAGLMLGGLSQHYGRGRLSVMMMGLLVVSMLLLARMTALEASMALMSLIGFSMVALFVNVNTMLQNEVPDGYRGRVMSLYTLTFLGLTPLGALVVGLIAERLGTPSALTVYAVITGILGAWIVLRWRNVQQIA